MQVQRASLSGLTPLDEGGFGKVYRVAGFTLPGDRTPLAYKEFTREHAVQGRAASASVAFRDGLNDADRAKLDQYAAWPRAVVTDANGTVCGLLMPLLTEEFFCRLDETGSGLPVPKPRQMGWLIASAKQRQDAQLDLPDVSYTERLLLLAQFVYAIGWLHKHGWVFGDLSFKNAVFALDPPRVMLLDCDGAAALDDAERVQASTPYWDPPECPIGQAYPAQDRQDTVTDVYKLGLAVLRCLTPGRGAASSRTPQRIADVLDADGVALVTRAISDDRTSRPTAKELYAYLRAVAVQRTAPPTITMARVATPVVQLGQQALVEWQLDGVGQVTVTVGLDEVATVNARSHPRGCSFEARATGPVRVEVTSPFGTSFAEAGRVTVFTLPPVSITIEDLPVPRFPELPAVSLEPISAAFAALPDVGAWVPEIPEAPTPDIAALVGELLPSAHPLIMFPTAAGDGIPAIPWPDFQNALIAAASAVSARLLREAERDVLMQMEEGQ